MKKFMRQETVDVYADACDCCGKVTHQSGCAVKLIHEGHQILFCHDCAPELVRRIQDMPACKKKTIGELMYFSPPGLPH